MRVEGAAGTDRPGAGVWAGDNASDAPQEAAACHRGASPPLARSLPLHRTTRPHLGVQRVAAGLGLGSGIHSLVSRT